MIQWKRSLSICFGFLKEVLNVGIMGGFSQNNLNSIVQEQTKKNTNFVQGGIERDFQGQYKICVKKKVYKIHERMFSQQ